MNAYSQFHHQCILHVVFHFFDVNHFVAGISKLVDCYTDLLRQPGDVEYEVCNLGKELSWAAALSQGLDFSPQPC